MKIEIKRMHLIIVALVLMAIVAISVIAQLGLFTNSVSWHPLQQVARDDTGSLSVDLNADGVIDLAGGTIGGACRLCDYDSLVGGINGCGGEWSKYNGRIGDYYVGGSTIGKNDNLLTIERYSHGCVDPKIASSFTAVVDICCKG